MRILLAADEYPWPARSGYRQRLHWMLRLLTLHGTVDLLVVREQPPVDPPGPPPDVPLHRSAVVAAGQVVLPRARRTGRWLTSGWPRAMVGRDWTAARALAGEWSEHGYDLVWFAHSPLYLALGDVLPRPHVVDLDNLESSLLRHRRSTGSRLGPQASSGPRQLARSAAARVDERRWRGLEQQIARTAEVTVVCSELDRRRVDQPRVRVMPNGYELPPGAGAGRGRQAAPEVDRGSVLLFVGLLTYEPNRDAAAFFADQVLPLVRARIPGARFRVVGRYGPDAVRRLHGLPGVEMAGEVPDLEAELRAASVSVVPIRFGGGTRIKILEAFAHSVPVVTTTVGCEGLEVVDRRHLLIADRPQEFAAACCALLEQEDLRRSIGGQGHSLWESRYRWNAVAPAVEEVLRVAAADRA
jgi:glycosyltransferase involved in cell wall biosynthesis